MEKMCEKDRWARGWRGTKAGWQAGKKKQTANRHYGIKYI